VASTWVVGDIHGCAVELQLLLDKLDLQEDDQLLSVGDLFHRGPDPTGVLRILQGLGSSFDMVNGNHELTLLNRLHGRRCNGLDDLRGDGRALMHESVMPVADELIEFIRDRDFIQRRQLGGTTWSGSGADEWLLVHGCVLPGQVAEDIPPSQLVRKGRLKNLPDKPFWFEHWQGPEFVVFGHAQSAAGQHLNSEGEISCFGLDTGCVYGGELSALRIEDLRIETQPNVLGQL